MFDPAPFIAARRLRAASAADETAALAAAARLAAERITLLLVEKYGATRVVLVGSLARGEFGAESDIDLVVTGLSDGTFYAAGAEAGRIGGRFAVDIVPSEAANALMLHDVARDGVVLHDAS